MPDTTKRYTEYRDRAVRALKDADAPGWRLAKVTHDAVTYLMKIKRMTKGQALNRWSADVNRPRFSPSNARRYFDVWEKYGTERDGASSMSFAEYYAIIRGGAPAKDLIERAREAGSGVHAALQRQWQEGNGEPGNGKDPLAK